MVTCLLMQWRNYELGGGGLDKYLSRALPPLSLLSLPLCSLPSKNLGPDLQNIFRFIVRLT